LGRRRGCCICLLSWSESCRGRRAETLALQYESNQIAQAQALIAVSLLCSRGDVVELLLYLTVISCLDWNRQRLSASFSYWTFYNVITVCDTAMLSCVNALLHKSQCRIVIHKIILHGNNTKMTCLFAHLGLTVALYRLLKSRNSCAALLVRVARSVPLAYNVV
jgi:hypothetical protein